MKTGIRVVVAAISVLAASGRLQAEQPVYFSVPLDELKITAGELPKAATATAPRQWRLRDAMLPRVVRTDFGEIYLEPASGQNASWTWQPLNYRDWHVVAKAAKGTDIVGRLFVPNPDFSGSVAVGFRIAAELGKADLKERFLTAKERHFQDLLNRDLPGGAWFRHQLDEVRAERLGKPSDLVTAVTPGQTQFARRRQLDETLDIFTGGKAVSENLQLDRTFVAPTGEATVAINSLQGITVAELDWKSLMKDKKPQVDPLATLLPQDQHAIFFPSFAALLMMMDEADAQGTPLLHMAETRAESAGTRELYERQLCLSATSLARLLGPKVIGSVAITGSDPYLRTGTDLAILFEARQPKVLLSYLAARHAQAMKEDAAVKRMDDKVNGVSFAAVRSNDRGVCSYVAEFGNVVIVSNSPYQLGRIAAVYHGNDASLATLPEYAFFRDRYPRGDAQESAFLILTDATIRRWCGPRWRIGSSRRTRAAAILAELQARYASSIVKREVKAADLSPMVRHTGLGDVELLPVGAQSSVYGSLRFMTPLAELDLEKVTTAEADAYRRFRDTYQNNWRAFFDPIAVRLGATATRLSGDLTVMPLIAGTEYRRFIDVTRKGEIPPDAGDSHPESMLHFIMALDHDSQIMSQANAFASTFMRELRIQPFSWVGKTVGVFFDDDPYWQDLAKAKNRDEFLRRNLHRVPIAFRADVRDALKATVFLSSLRAFVEQTAPNLTRWDSVKHGEFSYVRIAPTDRRMVGDFLPDQFAIYYGVTPEWFIVTPNEAMLKRAIDRHLQRSKGHPAQAADEKSGPPASRPPLARPWLGKNLGVQANRRTVEAFEMFVHDDYQTAMQLRAWASLPIMNEWKKLYPDRDPLEVHEQIWHARLICPGAGQYVWNEKWLTMESTAYGHPGEPKPGPAAPPALRNVSAANFGLTFENDGLRARVELERVGPTQKPK